MKSLTFLSCSFKLSLTYKKMSVAALPKIDSAERDPDKAVLEKVWYEETVPPIFRSQSNSRMSPSLKHSELADKHYDYVVIGAGIGGLYSAHLLANQLKSGSILVIDGRKPPKLARRTAFRFLSSHETISVSEGGFCARPSKRLD